MFLMRGSFYSSIKNELLDLMLASGNTAVQSVCNCDSPASKRGQSAPNLRQASA